MKLLLDTNALIDHIASREPYCHDIQELCIASYFEDVELWVPIQSYLDAMYSLRKFYSQRQLRDALLGSLEFFHPCGIPASDLRPALESDWPDVEDFVISRCAQHVDADYLVTRDAKGFAGSRVKVLSPKEAIALLHESGLTYDSCAI